MSDDGTREIVRNVILDTGRARAVGAGDAAAESASPVVLVDNPERVMPTGTNAAIRRATGEVIVLLGGHAELPAGYIRACVELLVQSGADCVGGALVSVGDGAMGEAIAAAMSSPFGIGNSGFRTATGGGPVEVDTIPFGAYRRSVFERVGLFNPSMIRHQDYEFNYRVRQAGGRMLLLPSLKATYHVRSSLAALWRQYWQYGIWKGRFVRRFPQSLRLRHLAPPLFTLSVVLAALLALAFPATWPLLATLAGAYLAFIVIGLVSFAARGQWRVLPYLPAVMVCLHFSYGLGIWLGLVLPRVPEAPRLDAPPGS